MTNMISKYIACVKGIFLKTTLRFRLVVLLVFIVILIPAIGMFIDYHRSYNESLSATVATLEEQARSLLIAHEKIQGDENYRQYVTEYCHQMNEFISPGHLIVILDAEGEVLVQARHLAEDINKEILTANPEKNLLELNRYKLAYTLLEQEAAEITIIVAQNLNHMEMLLRNQLINRSITTMVVVLALISIVYTTVQVWFIGPISHLVQAARHWSKRDFRARSIPAGPKDIRVLSEEFNAMANELEEYDLSHKREMEHARKIQDKLLPEIIPDIAGLNVIARYLPAQEVAGDLYDIIPLSEKRTAFVILDVCGHGISAALLTGVVKMSLHRRLSEQSDLSNVMNLINNDLLKCVPEGLFVSACVGIWDSGDMSWTYCAAGHSGGLLVSPKNILSLDSTASLLGVFEEQQWPVARIPLHQGDRLFMFTDGITEAPEYNMQEVYDLGSFLETMKESPMQSQIDSIVSMVQNFHGDHQKDDATIVAVEVL
jgi:sigma-B regulation protein RsbU (phosphoserine phosphatase)